MLSIDDGAEQPTMPPLVFELRHNDALVQDLPFEKFRSKVNRAVAQFLPAEDQPQTCIVNASWGPEEVRAGDYIGSEIGNPTRRWRIEKGVFESTYEWVGEGIARKATIIELYPLEKVTGNPETMVKIFTCVPGEEAKDGDKHCIERAGDVYLARGVKGELYRYPIAKANVELERVSV